MISMLWTSPMTFWPHTRVAWPVALLFYCLTAYCSSSFPCPRCNSNVIPGTRSAQSSGLAEASHVQSGCAPPHCSRCKISSHVSQSAKCNRQFVHIYAYIYIYTIIILCHIILYHVMLVIIKLAMIWSILQVWVNVIRTQFNIYIYIYICSYLNGLYT